MAEASASIGRTAQDICADIVLGRKARALLVKDLPPGLFLKRLLEHRQYPDAIRFMAHSMPLRDTIWWSCLCADRALERSGSREESAALESAVKWVLEPCAATMKQANLASREVGLGNLTGLLARSVTLTGRDASAADLSQAARLAGASVLMAASRCPVRPVSLNYRQFIGFGLDVADGSNHWTKK